jgi:hypothetical protein
MVIIHITHIVHRYYDENGGVMVVCTWNWWSRECRNFNLNFEPVDKEAKNVILKRLPTDK